MQDLFSNSKISNIRTNQVCYAILNSEKIVTRCMDLIGRFPRRLLRENEYILLGYHYDTNHIRVIPMKNRYSLIITEAWKNYTMTSKK